MLDNTLLGYRKQWQRSLAKTPDSTDDPGATVDASMCLVESGKVAGRPRRGVSRS
ncbi:MAG: hypothetical protein JWN48_765 [Myxococcaceae bacterium]|nr:hypothetical protein [Myxococcaceae bacterium]